MLKYMRKKGFSKTIIWIVAIIIIIAFGLGGTMYLLRDTSKQYAGRIFNKKISMPTFYSALSQARVQAMIQYGDKFNQVAPFLNLEAETWDRLILLHEANKMRMKVSNKDVVAAIQQYPFFQRNNLFDNDLYMDILKFWFKLRPRDFEEHTRDTLKLGLLYNKVTSDAKVTEKDVLAAFERKNEKVQVSYVTIASEDFLGKATFDENIAQEYYNENKDEFAIPPTINVEYVNVAIPEEATEEENTRLMEQSDNIYKALKDNQDIHTVAKKYNLEVKTSGFFSSEQPDFSIGWSYDLLNNIFDLNEGATIKPFESSNGITIAQIQAKRDAFTPAYEETKESVKKAVISIEAKRIAKTKAEEILKTIKDAFNQNNAQNFSDIARKLNLKIEQTPSFKRGEYLPNIGLSDEFQEAAFDLREESKLSNIVNIGKGFCILSLDANTPADPEKYLEEKGIIAEKLLFNAQNKLFTDFLNTMRTKANLENNIAKIKAKQLEEEKRLELELINSETQESDQQ